METLILLVIGVFAVGLLVCTLARTAKGLNCTTCGQDCSSCCHRRDNEIV